jgi:hypothetical protein
VERPVRPDDAVAGDHDRDRIRAERVARRAGGGRHARARRDLPVAADGAERDALGRGEDAALERCERREVDGELEPRALPGEVLVELALHLVEALRRAEHARAVARDDPAEIALVSARAVVDREHAPRSEREPERPERGVHHVDRDARDALSDRAAGEAFAGFGEHRVERHARASFTFFVA